MISGQPARAAPGDTLLSESNKGKVTSSTLQLEDVIGVAAVMQKPSQDLSWATGTYKVLPEEVQKQT